MTDVPAATATCYLLGSAVTRVGLLAMAASIQFDPLEVPRYLTEIHIVLPLHIHVIIYGDANVDAPTLCICNEADVPGGLLPSETLFSPSPGQAA